MRVLFWLGLLVLIVLAIKKKSQPLERTGPTYTAPPAPTSSKGGAVETMVCCAHCQIYLPASEAIYRGDQTYCSTAHADLH
ncbi:MAG: hypothetical protein KGM99_07760 [Burkholderiales bacterium]|nr:hypothetical protein [Burkholderiales bacterium]